MLEPTPARLYRRSTGLALRRYTLRPLVVTWPLNMVPAALRSLGGLQLARRLAAAAAADSQHAVHMRRTAPGDLGDDRYMVWSLSVEMGQRHQMVIAPA